MELEGIFLRGNTEKCLKSEAELVSFISSTSVVKGGTGRERRRQIKDGVFKPLYIRAGMVELKEPA